MRELREYRLEKKDTFFLQMPLCFIGRFQFSCLLPTATVDKRVTIRWTSASVTGETSRQSINSYSISRRFLRRSVLSTLKICILIFLHLPQRYSFNTIRYLIFACETNKKHSIASLLLFIIIYNCHTVLTSQITRWNYITLIIEREFSFTSHFKCIVYAFCMLHFAYIAHVTEICVANSRPFRRMT